MTSSVRGGWPDPRDWRQRYRGGSVLLVVILGAISALPVVILLLMPSCADLAIPEEPLQPKERLAFDVQPRVRVALAVRTRGGAALPIKVTGPYRLVDPMTQTTLMRGARLTKSPVEALSRGIVLTVSDAQGIQKTMHLSRLRIVPAKSGTLHVGGRQYRGILDLVYEPEAMMTLVNELDLEDYVGAVVPAEMFYYWPREVLRAQAIVARTYTLALITEAPTAVWHLEAGYVTAQEYKGMSEERAAPLEAVHSTCGLVLTHKGKVFRAYFSSCCGGHTEACGVTWDDYATIPPLAGKRCDYCKHSKWFDWKQVLKLEDIDKALKRAGRDVGTVREVEFTDGNGEGHVDRVAVQGTRGTVKVSGNDFRLAMGSLKLLSMNFTSRRVDDGYELTGHGWGHGCGMCQYGAKGMADLLKSHRDILAYYYPETELWKMY